MSDRSFPVKALSIRQPWAWAIIYGGKDIENRTWQAVRHGLDESGRFAVHASKGMTKDEYESTARFMKSLGVDCPPAADLIRGGIIGTVELVACVKESDSPWFFGPRGLVLRDPEPTEFVPCQGALGFFKWKRDDSVTAPIAKWMEAKPEEGWTVWRPSNESEEAKFCDLVCSECTKNHKDEGGNYIGCPVLIDAIDYDGDQILFNKEKGKIKCLKQQLKGQPKKYRCKETPDLFGVKA